MGKTRYKNPKRFEKLTTIEKLSSKLNVQKNLHNLDNLKNEIRIKLLKTQLSHDRFVIDTLNNNYPEIHKEIIDELYKWRGKPKRKNELELEILKEFNFKEYTYLWAKVQSRIKELEFKIDCKNNDDSQTAQKGKEEEDG